MFTQKEGRDCDPLNIYNQELYFFFDYRAVKRTSSLVATLLALSPLRTK